MVLLFDLPEELLIKILSYLPPRSLLSSQLVSRAVYSLITDSTSLTYLIECLRYGVVDCPTALPCPDLNTSSPGRKPAGGEGIRMEHRTAAEKLGRLREREKGWEELDGSKGTWSQLSAGDSPIYELQSGLFIRGTKFTFDLGSDPTPPSSGRPTALEIFTLPSTASSQPSDPLGRESEDRATKEGSVFPPSSCPSRVIDLGVGPILDFGIDPTQNLIVALTRPHLLRPSSPPSRPEFHSDPRTGPTLFPADHPSQAASPPSSPSSSNGAVADFETRLPTPPGYELHLLDLQGRPRMDIARHCLDLTIDEWDAENSWLARCCIQICESTLAVFLVNFTGEEETELLECFDWRTGRLTCLHVYPQTITTRSFALLSPSTYALTDFDLFNRSPRLNTYSFQSSSYFHSSSTSPSDDEDDGYHSNGYHSDGFIDTDPSRPRSEEGFDRWKLNPKLMASYQFPMILPQPLRETTFNFELRPDPPSTASGFVFDGSGFSSSPEEEGREEGGGGGRQRSFAPDWKSGVLSLDLVIDRRFFQGYLLKEMLFADAKQWREEGEVQAIVRPWVAWGLQNCRLIEDLSGQRHWVTFVVGHRAITQIGALSPLQQLAMYARGITPPPPKIAVLDFNPRTNNSDDSTAKQSEPSLSDDGPLPSLASLFTPLSTSPPGSYPLPSTSPSSLPSFLTSSSSQHSTATTTLPAQTTFGQDVHTRLPYRVRTLTGLPPGGTEGCRGVMLDEERIILTFKSRPDDDWVFKILSF